MKQQEIKEIHREYTRFWDGEIAMETYPVQIVLHHLPEGLLRCSVSTVDQEKYWMCEHTGKESLAKYCSGNELGKESVLWVYGGLLKNLKEVREYLLDANCLILTPEQIYVDAADAKIWNSYVPFYVKDIWKSMQELSHYLLGHIDKKDAEAVKIAYGMYRYFSQGGRNIEEAWEILCESAEEKEEKIESENEQEKIEKKNPVEKPFPMTAWVVMGLSFAAAVFLLAYVGLNEWYLSDARKILILILVVVLGAVGVLLWRRWGDGMKKKNPMEELEEEIKP